MTVFICIFIIYSYKSNKKNYRLQNAGSDKLLRRDARKQGHTCRHCNS